MDSFLPEEAKLRRFNPDDGLPDDLDGVNALLIRTVSAVNRNTLPQIPDSLGFLGTASAGTDHVDIEYLRQNGVAFAYAGGCNARAVAEYIVTALLLWADRRKIDLKQEQIGIIGVGNVGSSVHALFNELQWPSLLYDPPRASRDAGFRSAKLDETLGCSVLTFHVPFEKGGANPTHHWLNRDKLQNRDFKLIINTSRGGVVDERALLGGHENHRVEDFILDVWENEPVFNDLAAAKAFVKTPHIAGYSVQAKLNATRMVVRAMTDRYELSLPDQRPEPPVEEIAFTDRELDTIPLSGILNRIHPINTYQDEMEALIG
ncbi:MAG: NAD(P)-dependent oxidoreductase, partial [Balneolaceae bacterium]|nr:NAD(P)-dependent oxidoreductase [Balneolaceae bacterium]